MQILREGMQQIPAAAVHKKRLICRVVCNLLLGLRHQFIKNALRHDSALCGHLIQAILDKLRHGMVHITVFNLRGRKRLSVLDSQVILQKMPVRALRIFLHSRNGKYRPRRMQCRSQLRQ